MKEQVTRLAYCQYLLVSQINYPLTNFADHGEKFSHDAITRYLRREKCTPRLVGENVRGQVLSTSRGYGVFDDTGLDKNYSFAIALGRSPYRGTAKQVIKGIGVVTCVSVNPERDQFRLLDYRVYDPEGDGNSTRAHVREMLTHLGYHKQLSLQAVLMDTWDATKDLRLGIESLQKLYDCPRKDNRPVDDAGGERPYQRADALVWNAHELRHGKPIKIKGLPKDHKGQCLRVAVSTPRTDGIVTNDPAADSTEATQEGCGCRWKSEPLHREGKQLTGLERCQCRKARRQRNPSAWALLVGVRLKELAAQTGRTVYQLKHGLLDDYLIQQLRNPSIRMVLA